MCVCIIVKRCIFTHYFEYIEVALTCVYVNAYNSVFRDINDACEGKLGV